MRHLAALTITALVAACSQGPVNPPTEPAEPVGPPAAAPGPSGVGPASFVGRWAADPSWCVDPVGAERPIEISLTRFEGYENGCDITTVTESQGGYDVTLACEAEGQTTTERARLVAADDRLTLTWLDRAATVVNLTRCPATPAS